MISKETFIKTIEFLNKRDKAENKAEEIISDIHSDATGFWFLFSDYKTKIIELLNEAMDLKEFDDYGTELDYWYYELDQGKTLHKSLTKSDTELAEICFINNSADLYDYLTKKD